jgi:hypothetical protein
MSQFKAMEDDIFPSPRFWIVLARLRDLSITIISYRLHAG